MNRIEREKKTVGQMVEIFCHAHHGKRKGLCDECQSLLDYAYVRLDHCKFGENKTSCKKCPVHCYKPAMREQMRQVMRYAGPRMLWHHPVAAIKHMFQ
ncbi:MAG: nitrous oxide-stimulated promoter family protein [Bacteroidales bacterium]|nr:nitrous oxide-stimulated promoter family protein [Bacteroidales bacterium]